MHHALLQPAQFAVTAALLGWMISSFTPHPGRWLRWKMFCRARFVIIMLTGTKDGRQEEINPYIFLTPGNFLLLPEQLQTVVTWLIESGRYDRVDGAGRLLSVQGEHRIEVNNGDVVVV